MALFKTEPAKILPIQNEVASTTAADQTATVVDASGVDVDKRLSTIARRVVSCRRSLTKNILTIGENLEEAQKLLADHNGGVFTRWIREKCGFSSTTGYKYLAIWRTFGGCQPGLQRIIDVSAMRVLAAPSVNVKAVEDAIALAEGGEKITRKLAKQLVQEHTSAAVVSSKPAPIIYEDVQGAVIVRLADPAADPLHVLSRVVKRLMEERKAAA